MSYMSNLRQNLLEPVHNFHFFFKRAVVFPLSNSHSALDYRWQALRSHEVNLFWLWLLLLLILNVVLSLVPDLKSIVKQWVFEVEPQHTIIWLRVQAVLPRFGQDGIDLFLLRLLTGGTLLLKHLAKLNHLKEGVSVLRGELDRKIEVL